MYARPVVLWTDSWELVEQVRGYSQILTLIVTESADVAQQFSKISEAARNIGLVYALESGGAYFPDLNLRIGANSYARSTASYRNYGLRGSARTGCN